MTRISSRERDDPDSERNYGETWTFESLVGAWPGVSIPPRIAIGLQVVVFEAAVLAVGLYYWLPEAMVVGTVAVAVAGIGSAAMVRMGETIRTLPTPPHYRRLLFGSRMEVVLGVVAFVGVVTHLFVYDPRQPGPPLVESLFGAEPPVVAVYLGLLLLWDLTYRIGTSWWASVIAAWRSYVYAFDPDVTRRFRRADAWNVLFALVQLGLIPFVLDRPVLLVALLGHVGATCVAIGVSWYFLTENRTKGRYRD